MFFSQMLNLMEERAAKFNAKAPNGRGWLWTKFWEENLTDGSLNVPVPVAISFKLLSDKLKLVFKGLTSITISFSPMHSRADSSKFVLMLTVGGEGHCSASKTRFPKD